MKLDLGSDVNDLSTRELDIIGVGRGVGKWSIVDQSELDITQELAHNQYYFRTWKFLVAEGIYTRLKSFM